MECFSYRNLRVYQQAKDWVIYVYNLLKFFPKEENYALCVQLKRAVISVPSNIAQMLSGLRNSKLDSLNVKH